MRTLDVAGTAQQAQRELQSLELTSTCHPVRDDLKITSGSGLTSEIGSQDGSGFLFSLVPVPRNDQATGSDPWVVLSRPTWPPEVLRGFDIEDAARNSPG